MKESTEKTTEKVFRVGAAFAEVGSPDGCKGRQRGNFHPFIQISFDAKALHQGEDMSYELANVSVLDI